jgi:hypothetical protein
VIHNPGSAASIAAGPSFFWAQRRKPKTFKKQAVLRRELPRKTHKSAANYLLGIQEFCLARGGRATICMRRKTASDEYHGCGLQLRRKNKLRGGHNVIHHCYLLACLRSQTAVHRAVGSNAAHGIASIGRHHFIFMMVPRHSVAMMMRCRLSYPMAGGMLAAFHAGLRQ